MNRKYSPDCPAFLLGRRWLKTIPRRMEIIPLFGDASGRIYHTVDYGEWRAVLMHVAAVDSPEFGRGDAYQDFVDMREFLEQLGLPVPSLYARDDEQRVLLLEHLGNTTLYDAVTARPAKKLAMLKQAVNTLILWQTTMAKRTDFSSPADKKSFKKSLMMDECHHFYEYAVHKRIYHVPTAPLWNKLERHCKKIASELSRMPYLLSHRDFQSKNLMWHNNRWYIIDFQDALLAPVLYDLVALLRDSYISLRPEELTSLLRYFWDNNAVVQDLFTEYKEYERAFHLQTIQRKLKDAGRFIFLHQVKEKEWFLQFVSSTLQTVRYSMEQLELTALLRLLAPYFPEFGGGRR